MKKTPKEIILLKDIKMLKKQVNQYKHAYNVLMCYWDSLPEQDRLIIDKELKEVGL